MDDKELISKAIEKSGLSVRRFARERLVREPRTVWRWLAGENPLPAMVREALIADLGPEAEASSGEGES